MDSYIMLGGFSYNKNGNSLQFQTEMITTFELSNPAFHYTQDVFKAFCRNFIKDKNIIENIARQGRNTFNIF